MAVRLAGPDTHPHHTRQEPSDQNIQKRECRRTSWDCEEEARRGGDLRMGRRVGVGAGWHRFLCGREACG